MTKKQTELSEELREAVFEAARAGAAEAYTQNTGYVNYFKAMETLLYNYKKLAALVADEEAYCEVEYHAGRKTFSTTPQAKGFIQRKTEAEIVEEMRTRAVSDRSALHRSIVLLQRSVDSRGFRCAIYRSLVAD